MAGGEGAWVRSGPPRFCAWQRGTEGASQSMEEGPEPPAYTQSLSSPSSGGSASEGRCEDP